MTGSEPATRFPDLRGVNLLVVGLGKSGLAAARLAIAHGARVTVNDGRAEARLGGLAEAARAAGATLRAGGHPISLLDDAALIVVSPGVPLTIELLREARRRGIPIWGEIELAVRLCRGRIVGITGSNGKSTVTSMVGDILRRAGYPGGTGGNLSPPLSELLDSDSQDAVHSVELSSFQLETVETLQADVAVVLNLSPDHLDRYDGLEAYGRAKARLLELQASEAACILNADDEASRLFDDWVRARRFLFSTRGTVERGGFVRDGWLMLRLDNGEEALMERAELPLPGEHNVANALAAALACRLIGCDLDTIRRGLVAFRGLPHRLEHVRTLGGVDFYNDSKATNPASTLMALEAFTPGKVHLILGGRDKDSDWSALASVVGERARRVLLVGEAAEMLEGLLAGNVPTVACGTVPEAVVRGRAGAKPGDVVLLAPGCASFDQYASFEVRGNDFRQAVAALSEASDA